MAFFPCNNGQYNEDFEVVQSGSGGQWDTSFSVTANQKCDLIVCYRYPGGYHYAWTSLKINGTPVTPIVINNQSLIMYFGEIKQNDQILWSGQGDYPYLDVGTIYLLKRK